MCHTTMFATLLKEKGQLQENEPSSSLLETALDTLFLCTYAASESQLCDFQIGGLVPSRLAQLKEN